MPGTGRISRHLSFAHATVMAVVVFLAATFAVTQPPWSVGVQISDVPDYQRYGDAVTAGRVPFRDIAIEYRPARSPRSCRWRSRATAPTSMRGRSPGSCACSASC